MQTPSALDDISTDEKVIAALNAYRDDLIRRIRNISNRGLLDGHPVMRRKDVTDAISGLEIGYDEDRS